MNESLYLNQVEYKPIPNYSGWFVSSQGVIVSTRPINGKGGPGKPHAIKPREDRDGYMKCCPHDGIHPNLFVHVAVLSAWKRPKVNGEVSRHLDSNRKHNSVTNLEWGTVKENASDTRKSGSLKGEKNPLHRMSEDFVLKLRQEYINKPLAVLLKENPGYSKFAIWAAVSGYSWSHLPGAIPKNRRCSKDDWRSGIKLRNN